MGQAGGSMRLQVGMGANGLKLATARLIRANWPNNLQQLGEPARAEAKHALRRRIAHPLGPNCARWCAKAASQLIKNEPNERALA